MHKTWILKIVGWTICCHYKQYQFSKDNVLIDPEMLPIIKTSLIKLIDYKLEFFLTYSYIMPDGDYNKLKLLKTD